MNRWIILTAILLIVAAGISGYFIYKAKKTNSVEINGKSFNVELAQTDSERAKGLSGPDHLDTDSGMLFVFPKSDIYTFWMKDTYIPLDIIWLAPSLGSRARLESEVEGMYKIVDMATLQPQNDDNIPQYTPKNSANYVLELNSGTIIKYGFEVGDKVELNY